MTALPPAVRSVKGAARVWRVWHSATDAERAHGRLWYRDAHDLAAGLAAYHGKPLAAVAGIIAALSPSVSWDRNVAYARELLSTGTVARYTGYARNLRKAEDIFNGDAPDRVLGGPKVRAFYRLILDGGNDYDVCIDGHATNLVLGPKPRGITQAPSISAADYVAVSCAFRVVAGLVGVPAYEVQATTWLAWKRAINQGA